MTDREVSIKEGAIKVRDVLLYAISLCQDRPEFGRTALQKVVYFLSRALDRDFGHRPYYYGPYASPIETETEVLVLSNLVEERAQSLGFANASGFPAKQYEYRVTPTGEERIQVLKKRHRQDSKTIEAVIGALLEYAGRLDQRVLSAAAKVDYIAMQEGRPVSVDDVRKSAEDFGWSLTEPQVETVLNLLSKLGFVEVIP